MDHVVDTSTIKPGSVAVFKFELEHGTNKIQCPATTVFTHVDFQFGKLCVWALVPFSVAPSGARPDRRLEVRMTGEQFANVNGLRFIGTAQQVHMSVDGDKIKPGERAIARPEYFVLHVFEIR